MASEGEPGRRAQEAATDLIGLMPRDVVFAIKFLGESQLRLLEHFRAYMEEELTAAGMSEEVNPLFRAFVERHAILMRDFVFSGVSLQVQFRLDDMERLLGDRTSILRVDLWDQLKDHIETAERHFRSQLPGLMAQLSGRDAPLPPAGPPKADP